MEKTDPPLVVSDAGPIIHLDELASLDLLRGFSAVLIPSLVWSEISRHRTAIELTSIPAAIVVDVPDVSSPRLLALSDTLALDAGERTALRLLETQPAGTIFLTDDAAARLAAESLGLAVHGTLGILLRSIRQNYRSRDEVIAVLQSIPQHSTLHLSARLLDLVIARVRNPEP